MQTILRFKKENKIPNEAGNYNEKLKNIQKASIGDWWESPMVSF